jgi:hypothetical protein
MPMVQKNSELKSELKDDIERVKSSLLVTISESIDARTSRCLPLYHKTYKLYGRWIYKILIMTQAISALRTELEADTVEQLSSIKNAYCRSRIIPTWWWDREYKISVDTLDSFDLGSIDSRLATMIEDTKQELVKAINSVTSEQNDIGRSWTVKQGADKGTIATLNDKVLELEKTNLDDANGTKNF